MSVVGCEVVKCFAKCTTSEGALGNSLLVRFQVTIESGFVCKLLFTAGTFVGFPPSVDALMGLQII